MSEVIGHLSSQTVDFRFRLRIAADTPEGILLAYLRHGDHPSFSVKEMVIRALKAYWLPFAYLDHPDLQLTTPRQKRLAQEAVFSLKQQAREIEQAFELEAGIDNGWVMAAGPSIQPDSHLSLERIKASTALTGTSDSKSRVAVGSNLAQWIENDPFDSI